MSRFPFGIAFFVLSGILIVPRGADASIIIDNTTLGFYNQGIGNALNGTDPFFTGDPVLSISTAPNISAASTQLGGWLNVIPDLTTPGSTWSAVPVAIPTSWASGTETAVVYAFGSPGNGLDNVSISIGVDNGILVWLDGAFIHGNTAPGTAIPGEYVYPLGNLASGTHYLQFLRVGHGSAENWTIEVTGTPSAVPEPSSLFLSVVGILGLSACRHRRSRLGTANRG